MNEVFDLTSDNFDFDKLDVFIEKSRKDYVVHQPENGRITVTFTTEDDQNYSCIYFYKTNEEVYNMIKQSQPLDLRYTYIKDFDITTINSHEDCTLDDFNASLSFWDGRTCFRSANFGDGNVDFWKANFGDGDVSFSDANFGIGDIVFNEAKFGNGNVSFSGANFGNGNVSFHGAKLGDGNVDFWKADFGDGNVYFSGAEFRNGDVSFFSAQFGDGSVDFFEANFGNGDVSFFVANFGNGDVDFFEANFGDGNVDFIEANFGNGNVSFRGANFGNGNVSFHGAKLGDGNVDFWKADFGDGNVNFRSANFGYGIVNFRGAHLCDGIVDFRDSSIKSINFCNNTFASHVDLRFKEIDELIIKDCIIEKTIKCDKNKFGFIVFNKLSLLNTVNLGQIYIDWKSNNVYNSINDNTLTSEEKASQFRMLKENFHNIGYYDDEDKAYRAYMKFKTNNIKRCWMKIFGLIGGYGTQAWKVILAALAVVAAFGGIFTVPMQLAEKLPNDIAFSCSFFKGLYFSAITFLTIGYGDISPPNQTVALLAGIEGFLGLFLMSYFTVCVVRKLLR